MGVSSNRAFLSGLGFDTASSIALLALSALSVDVDSSSIVILPFLFTAGMSFVEYVNSSTSLFSFLIDQIFDLPQPPVL